MCWEKNWNVHCRCEFKIIKDSKFGVIRKRNIFMFNFRIFLTYKSNLLAFLRKVTFY